MGHGPRGGKGDAAFPHIDEMCALARYPNVTVKLTSVPSYAVDPYPHRGLHKYLRRLYDSFGPKRLHWGSDLTRMPCSYALCVRLFTEELRWLTGEDLEWIMGRSICERLGWAPTSSYLDDQDLYIEQLNPADQAQVLTPDGYKPLRTRPSIINVKGAPPVTIIVGKRIGHERC